MFIIQKSALFMQQWQSYAHYYRDQAGISVAGHFIDSVEEAVHFISQQPYACALYDIGEGYEDLKIYKFRKLNLRGFPHKVLFRANNEMLFIEVLYTHKMNVPERLMQDKK